MTKKFKEKVIVSACLLGVKCRYNGKDSLNNDLITKLKDFEVITICPEELGGLPTPRPKAELKKDGSVMNEFGVDVTDNFIEGAAEVLKIAVKENITKAYLKDKSPSCGSTHIYRDGVVINGTGVTAQILLEHHVDVIPV